MHYQGWLTLLPLPQLREEQTRKRESQESKWNEGRREKKQQTKNGSKANWKGTCYIHETHVSRGATEGISLVDFHSILQFGFLCINFIWTQAGWRWELEKDTVANLETKQWLTSYLRYIYIYIFYKVKPQKDLFMWWRADRIAVKQEQW